MYLFAFTNVDIGPITFLFFLIKDISPKKNSYCESIYRSDQTTTFFCFSALTMYEPTGCQEHARIACLEQSHIIIDKSILTLENKNNFTTMPLLTTEHMAMLVVKTCSYSNYWSGNKSTFVSIHLSVKPPVLTTPWLSKQSFTISLSYEILSFMTFTMMLNVQNGHFN